MTELWLVVHDDKHTDVEVLVFATRALAMQEALARLEQAEQRYGCPASRHRVRGYELSASIEDGMSIFVQGASLRDEPTSPASRRPVAHLVGANLTVAGRLQRQRCAWCGLVLGDYDLAHTVTAPGCRPGPPGAFAAGTWVEVTEGNPRQTVALPDDGDRMPPNSCMALELDLLAAEERR